MNSVTLEGLGQSWDRSQGTESGSPGAPPHLLEVTLQLGVSFLGLTQLAVSSAQLLLQLAHLTAQHRQALPQLAHLGSLPLQCFLQLCRAPVRFSNGSQAIGKGLERERRTNRTQGAELGWSATLRAAGYGEGESKTSKDLVDQSPKGSVFEGHNDQ